MLEAISHISYRSQGSLGPDDSVSQVLPPYFCNNSQLDMEEENDDSAPSGRQEKVIAGCRAMVV